MSGKVFDFERIYCFFFNKFIIEVWSSYLMDERLLVRCPRSGTCLGTLFSQPVYVSSPYIIHTK